MDGVSECVEVGPNWTLTLVLCPPRHRVGYDASVFGNWAQAGTGRKHWELAKMRTSETRLVAWFVLKINN